jgi:hypothetical protein
LSGLGFLGGPTGPDPLPWPPQVGERPRIAQSRSSLNPCTPSVSCRLAPGRGQELGRELPSLNLEVTDILGAVRPETTHLPWPHCIHTRLDARQSSVGGRAKRSFRYVHGFARTVLKKRRKALEKRLLGRPFARERATISRAQWILGFAQWILGLEPGQPRSIERPRSQLPDLLFSQRTAQAAPTVASVIASRATNRSQFPLILESGSVGGSPTG